MQLRGSASYSMGLEAGRRSVRGRVLGHKISELSTEVQIDSRQREEGQGWNSRQKALQEQEEEVRKQHGAQGPVPKGTSVCYWKIDGKRERYGE